MRVRFANLIRNGGVSGGGLLGTVKGFTFEPILAEGFFDYVGVLYPKAINLSFTFDVLHEHIMGWTDASDSDGVQWAKGADGSGFPYITPRQTPDNSQADLYQSAPLTSKDENADIDGLLQVNFTSAED